MRKINYKPFSQENEILWSKELKVLLGKRFPKTKLGQIWVETVIYTLIGLSLLGILLAFAVPEIQKQKDKAVISATINAMSELDNNIVDVRRNGVGNVREMSFLINRGSLVVDSPNDKIAFVIEDSSFVYSEIGRDVVLTGTNLKVLTEKNGKKNRITLTLDYRSGTRTNITYNGVDNEKSLTPASISYNFIIENLGRGDINDPNSYINVDLSS
ncbi:MAG: hypothetical protein AABX03_01500 [Nanoarchaeota archaeon]